MFHGFDFDLVVRGGQIYTGGPLGVLEDGAVAVSKGRIAAIGRTSEIGRGRARRSINATGKLVLPGLIDAHTHLLEYAVEMVHGVHGRARRAAGFALLLEALKTGVTTLGEHCLGHPLSHEHVGDYRAIMDSSPLDGRFATGIGVLGTQPLSVVCSVVPGRILTLDEVNETLVRQVAKENEFPGENIITTASVANLPPEKTPLAGQVAFSGDRLRRVVEVFHEEGSRVGAHIEGAEIMQDFAKMGGDVVHHAHGLDQDTAQALAKQGVKAVMTPAAGTSRAPNSPDEVSMAYHTGVEVSLATDSVIPLHKDAKWVGAPPGTWIGPEYFFRVIAGGFKRLQAEGVEPNDLLKLIALNPARVLGMEDMVGSLEVGKQADLVVTRGFPGLDLLEPGGVEMVIKAGVLQMQRG